MQYKAQEEAARQATYRYLQSQLTNTATTSYTSSINSYQTTYNPSTLGQTITISGNSLGGAGFYPAWQPQIFSSPAPPVKSQVINWGGRVYYQPSETLRALVDALRLI